MKHDSSSPASRHIWYVAVVAAVILAGLTAHDIWKTYQNTLQASRAERHSLSRVADANISGYLRMVDAVLHQVRDLAALHGPESPVVTQRLNEYKGLFPFIASIGVINAHGISMASTTPSVPGTDLSHRGYFRFQAQSGLDRFYLSEPFDTVARTHNMVASRPMLGSDGAFQGVVTALLWPSFFQDVLTVAVPAHNGAVVLLGHDLIVRMRVPFAEKYIGMSVKGRSPAEEFIRSGLPLADYRNPNSLDNVERLVTFRSLDFPPDLLLAVAEDASEVLAPWRIESMVNVGFCGAGVFLILLLARQASRGAAKAEETNRARRSQEILFATLLKNLPVEAWARDRSGSVIFQSESCVAAWGDLKGEPNIQAIPSSTLTAWQARNQLALKGEIVREKDEEALPDGRTRMSEVFVGPIRDGDEITGVMGVNVDISEKVRLECDLFATEQKYKTYVEGADDLITSVDTNGNYLFVNRKAEEVFGQPASALMGTPAFDHIHPQDKERTLEAFQKWLETKNPHFTFENRLVDHAGGVSDMSWTISPFFDTHGALVGFNSIARDISGLRKAEETVRRSLEEKEVMLKEIHHRVKNNLQIILSLLHLQCGADEDLQDNHALSSTYNRVRAMSLVHEQLYKSGDLAAVDLSAYVPALARNIRGILADSDSRVELDLLVEPERLHIEQAIPFGLLLNELVTNAFKHAFPPGRTGRLRVSIARDEDGPLTLVVADNGPGLPDGFRLESRTTLGSQLITSLTAQLGGTVTAESGGGTRFTVRFRASSTVTVAA